jgi:hypothetical protein
VEDFWINSYKITDRFPVPATEALTTIMAPERPSNRLLQRLYDYAGEEEEDAGGDEYQIYLSEARIKPPQGPEDPTFDPLLWWMETAQQIRFPKLSKMAIDLFTAPAQSSDNERLFSKSKFTVTDLRTRLSPKVVEDSLCLKSWAQFK